MKTYFVNHGSVQRIISNVIEFKGKVYADNSSMLGQCVTAFDDKSGHHVTTYDGDPVVCIDQFFGEVADKKLIEVLAMEEVELKTSAYSIERAYGGPEEGGWYFDAFVYLGPADLFQEDNDNGIPLGYTNSNGIVRHYRELFVGDNEMKAKPHYQ